MLKKMNVKKNDIAVVHPGKQMSYNLALALNELERLSYFYTSFYVKNNAFWKFVLKFISYKYKKPILRRRKEGLPDNKVKTISLIQGLLTSYHARKGNKKLFLKNNAKLNNNFGRKVYKKTLFSPTKYIISSAVNSLSLFNILKKNNSSIIRVLEMPILAAPYTNYIFKKDIELYGDNGKSDDFGIFLDNKYINERKQEIELADRFLVPSSLSKDSLIFSGAKKENIYVAMYPFEILGTRTNRKIYCEKKIKILYVGNVSANKGVHHLLNVFKRINYDDVELTIVGKVSDYIKNNYPNQKNVSFIGFVDHNDIPKIFSEHDIFVFPSLSDGFPAAVIEAMQFGLAVVCSKYAGAADFVLGSGIVFDPLDEESLFTILKELICDKALIEKLGLKCKEAVFSRKADYKAEINYVLKQWDERD